MNDFDMSYYLLGERAAVLQSNSPSIDIACQRQIWATAERLRHLHCCIDIVPGMNNLTAIFDPFLHKGENILDLLKSLWEDTESKEFTSREVLIPTQYGGAAGPDLEVVALHNGLQPEDVVALHAGARYIVYFLGFQPGFAYMGGLPKQLATPRRSEPRTKVPAGSIGIGGEQTGIYPAASPGGWQLIGKTDLYLFDPHAQQATLLAPGDIVRFVAEHIDV